MADQLAAEPAEETRRANHSLVERFAALLLFSYEILVRTLALTRSEKFSSFSSSSTEFDLFWGRFECGHTQIHTINQ